MPQPATCPHCQKVLKLPDNSAGRTLRCPECQGRSQVVEAEGAPRLEALEPPPKETIAPVVRSRRASPSRERSKDEGTNRGRRVPYRDYLLPAILSTVFCFWPLGIAAIIFAAKANSLRAAGNHERAAVQAAKARKFIMWTVLLPVVLMVIYVILAVLLELD